MQLATHTMYSRTGARTTLNAVVDTAVLVFFCFFLRVVLDCARFNPTSRCLPFLLQAVVMALAPATMVSRRCTQKARGIFLREINAGGLVLLNEVGIDRWKYIGRNR